MEVFITAMIYTYSTVWINVIVCMREKQRPIVYAHVRVGYIHVNKRVSNEIIF